MEIPQLLLFSPSPSKWSLFAMIETYVWFVPHTLRVSMITGVAALIVSIPAVKVALCVQRVKSIEAGIHGVMKVLAGGPPHVGVTLQWLQPLPGSLLDDEISTPGHLHYKPFSILWKESVMEGALCAFQKRHMGTYQCVCIDNVILHIKTQ